MRAQQDLRSPVHNAVSVEGHEVDLTAATRTDGCKKHLKIKGDAETVSIFKILGDKCNVVCFICYMISYFIFIFVDYSKHTIQIVLNDI